MILFYGETIIIFVKPKIMGSTDDKRVICLPVDNNSCSSCISHEITLKGYISMVIYCNVSIDDVESHTPYVDVFV